ncbi:hypothetical protein ACR6AP_27610, partial [Klebsiella variicola]|uniref:hypothetical protein n=1 Tax=Klebsiella variicola TaxID=244366 RepID=UPI003DA403AC
GDARPVATFHQSYRFPNGKSYEPAIKEPAKEKKGYFVYKQLNNMYINQMNQRACVCFKKLKITKIDS